MENVQPTPRLHPLVAGAAGAVIIASAVAVAAIAGYLPGSTAEPQENGVVMTSKSPVRMTSVCRECGVVLDVKEETVLGKGTGAGALAGGVAGAVIGHDIGDGSRAGTAVGAVVGGIAGHQIERSARSTKRYQIRVRMQDGSVKTVLSDAPPAWRPGDKVRVHRGALRAV